VEIIARNRARLFLFGFKGLFHVGTTYSTSGGRGVYVWVCICVCVQQPGAAVDCDRGAEGSLLELYETRKLIIVARVSRRIVPGWL
jgi:hypothetical protein